MCHLRSFSLTLVWSGSGGLDDHFVNIDLPNSNDSKRINFENGIIMLDSILRRSDSIVSFHVAV